jgi:vacuolar-type H+-ATPase subunit F/Vma7
MALGFSVFEASDAQAAEAALHKAAKSGEYAVIFITEDLAPAIKDAIDRYKDAPLPAVTVIPGRNGGAGYGMAAINAFHNTPARMEALAAYEPFAHYCTDGLDLRGKQIGVIGHLNMPDTIKAQAKKLWLLERNPQPGDYPDSACDWILPQCDIVIITASTLVNKTLPHLLETCQDAYTILAGPSCPMCPALLNFGIDRIAGLVITDVSGMKHKIRNEIAGPPYPMGKPFLLSRDRL